MERLRRWDRSFRTGAWLIPWKHACRVVSVGWGGSRGTSPLLDLTFPPTGLSENLGAMERGRGGKGEIKGWGKPSALLPPPLASASNTTLHACDPHVLPYQIS